MSRLFGFSRRAARHRAKPEWHSDCSPKDRSENSEQRGWLMKNYFKSSTVQPNEFELGRCFDLMSRIDELAPSDATVSAIIRRLANGSYHTIIPVRATDSNFASGSFFAEGNDLSLAASLKSAQAKMLEKLRKWKLERF